MATFIWLVEKYDIAENILGEDIPAKQNGKSTFQWKLLYSIKLSCHSLAQQIYTPLCLFSLG